MVDGKMTTPEKTTSGNGAFVGMMAGGFIGLMFGPLEVIFGAVCGAIIGHKIEKGEMEK